MGLKFEIDYHPRIIFVVACLFFGMLTLHAQRVSDMEVITKKLTAHQVENTLEKTYIHTDKDMYIPGETIWYKGYLLDGSDHGGSDKSNVLHIELLNERDSIVAKQQLYVKAVGTDGNLDIPETLMQGNYTLKAYTKYMLNEREPLAFSKTIAILDLKKETSTVSKAVKAITPEKRIALQFFPGGGTLVYGLQNTIGVKAVDQNGQGLSVSGKIIDENGKVVTSVETYDFGLGKFNYVPLRGKSYFAVLDHEGTKPKYALPIPITTGAILHVRNALADLSIRIESNANASIANGLLVGHVRGRTFISRRIPADVNNLSIKINKEKLQKGVAHFTLFTAKGEPVCERLTFIDKPDGEDALKVRSILPAYKSRDRVDVTLDMDVKEEGEGDILGVFSVAVTSEVAIKKKNKRTIESWLLLNSDIGGTIPDAAFFFDSTTTKKRYLLDALMLTHGWRRFVWKEVLDDTGLKPVAHEPEKGIMIKGRTTAFNNKFQFRPSFVRIDVLGKEMYREKKVTDATGNFTFGPYVFQEKIRAMIQSEPMNVSKKERDNKFWILIDDSKTRIKVEDIRYIPQDMLGLKQSTSYVEQALRKQMVDFKLDPNAVRLDEVTIAAKPLTKKEEISGKIKSISRYQLPNQRIFVSDVFGAGALQPVDLMRNVPGLRVARNQLSVRGGGPPIYLLDGFQVESQDISLINPNEIAVIDILKDGNAAVFGPGLYGNSANGVIAIYTNSALDLPMSGSSIVANITNLDIKGFYKAREFYSPAYDIPKPEHKELDYRTTLFWEPNVIIDKKGFANLKFYTGDVAGNYQIVIEGITVDGTPISEIQSFEVAEEEE